MQESVEGEGGKPTPEGAPEVAPDPRVEGGFEVGRPRLGGFRIPVRFSRRQAAILNAAADEIIPPGKGFPAPSEVDVVEFIGRYVTPKSEDPIHYPFAGEEEFKAAVDRLGEGFVSANSAQRVEVLESIEEEDETFFSQLRNLIYFGYYSRPEVIRAINKNLEAGRDYHGPPQPYGYAHLIEEWGDTRFPRERGEYVRTEDVAPVNGHLDEQ